MRAGTLNKRITLQKKTMAPDPAGQRVETWVDIDPVWANVRFLSGIETIKSDADVNITKASIRIRKRPDVTVGMRVLFRSIILNILAVLPDEQGDQYIDLACETGADNG